MGAPKPEHTWIRGENGLVFQQRLPLPDYIQDRLIKGYLTEVADEFGTPLGAGYTPRGADDAGVDAGGVAAGVVEQLPEPPSDKAAKREWVGYVSRHLGVTPDDAEAMTKHDLMDKVAAARAERQTVIEAAAEAAEAADAEPAGEAGDEPAGDEPAGDDSEDGDGGQPQG